MLVVEGKKAPSSQGSATAIMAVSMLSSFGAALIAIFGGINPFAPTSEALHVWWLVGASLFGVCFSSYLDARGQLLVVQVTFEPHWIVFRRPEMKFTLFRTDIASYDDGAPDYVRLLPRTNLRSYRYVIPTLTEADRVAVLEELDEMGIARRERA
jgi:hypothetical protein